MLEVYRFLIVFVLKTKRMSIPYLPCYLTMQVPGRALRVAARYRIGFTRVHYTGILPQLKVV